MKINPIYFVLAIILIGVSIYFNYRQFMTGRADAERMEAMVKNDGKKSAIIERYIAPSDSTNHAKVIPAVAKNADQLEILAKNAISPTYVDSLKQALNIKDGQLQELTRIKGTVSGSVKTTAIADSLGNKTFAYNGKWLNFSLNTADSVAKYRYRPELTIAKVKKGNWLTGKRTYSDISFVDPNAIIDDVGYFTLAGEAPKRFGLGIQAGYYYDPIKRQFLPAIGLGISYNLVNF